MRTDRPASRPLVLKQQRGQLQSLARSCRGAVLTCAILIPAAACRDRAEQPFLPASASVFSATLRQALVERSHTLSSKRSALPLSGGASADSCETYLWARKAGARIAESVDAQLVASEYLICEAVDLLPAGSAFTAGAADELGEQLARRLDLRSFPSSLGPQLNAERYTLAALSSRVESDDSSAVLADESSSIRVEVAAEADLNQDGQPDWIVWLADESHDGNYRGYATLVIYAATASQPMRAKVYPGTG